MIDLMATSPFGQSTPVQIGELALTEAAPAPIHALQPFPGRAGAVSQQLHQIAGLSFPEPGQETRAGDLRCLWAGRETAFLVGAAPDLAPLRAQAAITEQSDAWAILRLSGDSARDVLARLTPLDLRPHAFGPDKTARTELAHMSALLVGVPSGIEVWVMRSMALTAVNKISHAMAAVAARAARLPEG